jgi:hypothetical protein
MRLYMYKCIYATRDRQTDTTVKKKCAIATPEGTNVIKKLKKKKTLTPPGV